MNDYKEKALKIHSFLDTAIIALDSLNLMETISVCDVLKQARDDLSNLMDNLEEIK